MQITTSWKPVQTTTKKSSKFIKKITHVDDIMIYNLVKYLVQTRLRLWDEICYFYISQTKSSLDKIFYKVVYHHIIYMCDFFDEFRWLFLPWFAWVFTKVMVSTRYVPEKEMMEGAIVFARPRDLLFWAICKTWSLGRSERASSWIG